VLEFVVSGRERQGREKKAWEMTMKIIPIFDAAMQAKSRS
jgi:hypothetical protein